MKKVILSVLLIASAQVITIFGQGKDASNILGRWETGGIGAVAYQNEMTGSIRPGRATVSGYRFLANGNYEFIGYVETTTSGCTSTLFNEVNGRYQVEGSIIKLNPGRDLWKSGSSCGVVGGQIQTKTPAQKSLEFQAKEDARGNQLLCLRNEGAETCYKREK